MRQGDVAKKATELFSNMPQKLVSSFKIPKNCVQMVFLTHDKVLSVGFRSIDSHTPIWGSFGIRVKRCKIKVLRDPTKPWFNHQQAHHLLV